jgi:hypothetical protein
VDDVRDRFLLLTAISALVGLLGSLAAVYLFSTGIVRRVRMLEANAELLARGEALTNLPEDADEIGKLAQRLARASALLRAREQALRESEERFRLVIEEVRDYGIFALDPTAWYQLEPGRAADQGLGGRGDPGPPLQPLLPRRDTGFPAPNRCWSGRALPARPRTRAGGCARMAPASGPTW